MEVQRNRGAQVREITIAEAVEITEVRMVVEGLIAAPQPPNASTPEAGHTELDEIGRPDAPRPSRPGSSKRYSDLNVRLHALGPRHRRPQHRPVVDKIVNNNASVPPRPQR